MNVYIADEQDVPVDTAEIRALAEEVLRAEGLPDDTDVTVLFVDPEQIAEYNRRFMDREGPTDVLAFPLEQLQPGKVAARPPGSPPLNLGDVVIAPAVVRDQAAAHGVPFEDELALMVVHGILHLLGYDHHDDREAEAMEARERTLLAKVGRTRP